MAFSYVDAADVPAIVGNVPPDPARSRGHRVRDQPDRLPAGSPGPGARRAGVRQEEIYYCISGSGILEIDGEDARVPPRSLRARPTRGQAPPAGGVRRDVVHVHRRRARRRLRAVGRAGERHRQTSLEETAPRRSPRSRDRPHRPVERRRRRGRPRDAARPAPRAREPLHVGVERASERFGALVVGDDDDEVHALAEARSLLGREPDLYEEFDSLLSG